MGAFYRWNNMVFTSTVKTHTKEKTTKSQSTGNYPDLKLSTNIKRKGYLRACLVVRKELKDQLDVSR